MNKKNTYSILLIEDEPGDAGLIRRALRDERFGRFETTWATAMAEARHVLAEQPGPDRFDAVLLDLSLPDSTGMDTVRGGLEAARHVPVVILTGRDDADFALQAMDLGIQDYLVKGMFNDDVLIRALRHAMARSQADQALRESKDKFQSLVANIPGVSFRCKADKDWTMMFISDQIQTLTGYPAGDFLNNAVRTYASVIHADDLEHVEAVINEAIRSKTPWEIEYRTVHRDESVRWVYEKGMGVVDGTGNVVSLDGFIMDVTGRKKAGDALAAAETRMRTITESAQDAIVMMDPEGRISFWNPAAERIFGYARDEALGQDLHLFLAPGRYHDAYLQAMTFFRQTGKGDAVGRTLELEACRKDGREIPVELSLAALKTPEGWCAVGVMRDITQRKQADQKLQEYARQLEQNNTELDEALFRAEEATRAKSAFLANMSHEIRTPMNGVIGMTGLLLETDLDQTQRRYAETVRSSGETLLALINDILDFSKIEAGKLDLECVDFDLRAMLDDFAAVMAFKAEEKGLEFICFADPDVPDRFCGDPGRLRQILTNLAGNAIKFTRKGEVEVRVSLVSLVSLVHGSRFNGSAVAEGEVQGSGFSGSVVGEGEVQGSLFSGSAVEGGVVVGAKNLSPDGIAPVATYPGAPPAPTVNRSPSSTVNREPLNREPHDSEPHDSEPSSTVNREPLNREPSTTVNREPLNLEPHDSEPRIAEVRFTVRDTGIGIPEDKQGLLFESFSQVDPSTTREFGGTGLGLAISRQLAGMMGGEVGVHSEEGQGSTFWFTARLGVAAGATRRMPVSADLHGTRTLVVDDNAANRELLQTRLTAWGMRVDAAADGPSALGLLYKALAEGDAYGLAILDMQMPGMDGESLGRAIRTDEQMRAMRLVMMTSAGQRGDARRLEQIGFSGYLHKPVPHDDLRRCLALALAESDRAPLVTRHTIKEADRGKRPDFSGSGARILLVEDNLTNQEVALAMLKNLGLSADVASDGAAALKALKAAPYDLVFMDVQMPVMDGLEATRRIRASEVHGSRFNGSAVGRAEVHGSGFSGSAEGVHGSRFNGSAVGRAEVQGSRFNGSAVAEGEVHGSGFSGSVVEEAADGGVGVGAKNLSPDDVAPNTTYSSAPPAPTVNRTPSSTVNREPLNLEPSATVNREPLNLEPYDSEPLNLEPYDSEPLNREPSSTVNREPLNREPSIPIIALTAHAMKGDRERFLEAGLDDYLPKPLEPESLAAILAKWLPGRTGAAGRAVADASAHPVEPAGPDASFGDDSPAVFDRADLYRRLMDEKNLVQKVLGMFLENLPGQVARFEAALEDEDHDEAHLHIHAVKGAAGNVGGQALRALGQEMETMAMNRDMAGMKARLPELGREIERISSAVHRELHSLQAARGAS